MPTRLVLDELDLDLSALAAGLVIVVVVIVLRRALSLHAAAGIALESAIVAIGVVVDGGRRVLVVLGDFRGHGCCCCLRGYVCLGILEVLTACGRSCCVGISSLEVAGLERWEWMAARVTGECRQTEWERLDPNNRGG